MNFLLKIFSVETINYSTVSLLAGAFLLAFFVCFFAIPYIIKSAHKNKWVDEPNYRKVHSNSIPTLGGIGIFTGIVIGSLLGIPFFNIEIALLFLAIVLLFTTGIIDDLKDLSASKKFIVQFLAAAIIATAGLRITSLDGLFGIYTIPVSLQYVLTILMITGVTNAFNLIDGIDGLAGGLGFLNAVALGGLLFYSGCIAESFIAFALAGSLLAFLRYNFNPAKIFMGDTGSLVIGFCISVLGLKVMDANHLYQNPAAITNSFVLVSGIILIPVFDTFRVFGVRIMKGKSPFSPDKNHIHHLLMKTGYNHKKAALILYVSNILLFLFSFLMKDFHSEISFILLLILAIIFIEILTIKRFLMLRLRLKKLSEKSSELLKENRFLKRE